MASDDNQLLPRMSAKSASVVLGVCDRTLRNWRRDGIGPTWVKRGRKVLYDQAAVFALSPSHAIVSGCCPHCGKHVQLPVNRQLGGRDA